MAEVGWNVAIIKDRAREMGIELSEAQAQDILNKTFKQEIYGADPNAVMSILQSMKSGGGSSPQQPTLSEASQPPSDFERRFTSALERVRRLPEFQTQPDTQIQPFIQRLTEQSEQLARRTEQMIPLVARIYENLSQQLERARQAEIETVQKFGEARIGREKAALASEGVSAGTGAVVAPIRMVEEQVQAEIGKVAEKYNLKQEQLAQQHIATIEQLRQDAERFRLQGAEMAADLATKAATLRQRQQELMQQMALDIAKAATSEEQARIEKLYQEQLLALRRQQLEIDAQLARERLALQGASLSLRQAELGLSAEKLKLAREEFEFEKTQSILNNALKMIFE